MRDSDVVTFPWPASVSSITEVSGNGAMAYVQNQSLMLNLPNENGGWHTPNTIYPFTRLASYYDVGSSAINIYHQLNESLLVKDTYDADNDWYSINIQIETNN